jgi:hypothetical protein
MIEKFINQILDNFRSERQFYKGALKGGRPKEYLKN